MANGGSALGQQQNNTRLESQLRSEWYKICQDLGDLPWANIIERAEPLVQRAKHLEGGGIFRDHLDAMILARDYETPEDVNVLNATPKQLIEMLTESQLLGIQKNDRRMITMPLIYMSGSTDLLWDRMANKPIHEYVDPAVAAYQRGREMIPHLIDALDDMTATHSAIRASSSNRWAVMVKRCDYAMAMLEAITRIEFAPVTHDHGFALQPKEDRDATIALIREWWDVNKDAAPLEARLWALKRVGVPQSLRMLTLLRIEKHEGLVIEHLHNLLKKDLEDNNLRDVATRLARLNDHSGIDRIRDKVATAEEVNSADVRLLAQHGDREVFELLARRYSEGVSENDKRRMNAASNSAKYILDAVRNSDDPNAVVVFAQALFRDDALIPWPENSNRQPHNWAHTDMAAEHIQRLTGRDFGYNKHMKVALRRVAIDHIRAWWQEHGEKEHQMVSATDGRADAIR